jgi:hypothetical protein
VDFFAAAYVGREKTPYYSKIIDSIWEFRLFGWVQKAVNAAGHIETVALDAFISYSSSMKMRTSSIVVCLSYSNRNSTIPSCASGVIARGLPYL